MIGVLYHEFGGLGFSNFRSAASTLAGTVVARLVAGHFPMSLLWLQRLPYGFTGGGRTAERQNCNLPWGWFTGMVYGIVLPTKKSEL